jgi:hypothetical protein
MNYSFLFTIIEFMNLIKLIKFNLKMSRVKSICLSENSLVLESDTLVFEYLSLDAG